MEPIKKEDLNQEIFDIYDEYVHSKIDRREFVNRLSIYAVGGLTVAAILSSLLPNYAEARKFQQDDPRLITSYQEYNSPKGGGRMKGLLSQPTEKNGKLPGIIVVHENRGLNPYIEDVAQQAALDGFITFAPDVLTPFGGYPGSDDEGRPLQAKRDREEMLQDFIAAFDYLKMHDNCSGDIGVVGFCFGGWISNMMAVRLPDLKAAAPFYGGQASQEETSSIQAPLLIHYAENDPRVNEGWPNYKAALRKDQKEYITYFYPGTSHGFHNHSTPRYDKEAAELAWGRTIKFFTDKLG